MIKAGMPSGLPALFIQAPHHTKNPPQNVYHVRYLIEKLCTKKRSLSALPASHGYTKRTNPQMKKKLPLVLLCCLPGLLLAQLSLNVTVTSGTATTSCTDLFSSPDPMWSVSIEGGAWVDYPQSGPCFAALPNLQYQQGGYTCVQDLPATVNICFRAFENDGILPCQVTPDCEEIICQDFPLPPSGSGSYTLSLPSGLSSSGEVNFDITITGTFLNPLNDDICQAVDLGLLENDQNLGNPSTDIFHNFCATAINEPDPGLNGAYWSNNFGVWFTFTTGAEPLNYVELTTLSDPQNMGDGINLQIAVYEPTGNCSEPMQLLAESYDTTDWNESLILHCLQANTTYYILVDGTDLSPDEREGYFGLGLQSTYVQEAPDEACEAEDLGNVPEGGSVSTSGWRSNYCATSVNDPYIANFWPQKTVWFSFTPPPSGHVLIQTISDSPPPSGLDEIGSQISVYWSTTGNCNGIFIYEDSAYDPNDGKDESLELHCLNENFTYWVLVDGDGDVDGRFTLTITDLGDESSYYQQDITICAGENFQAGFSSYDSSGIYFDTLTLPSGCDSIIETNLTVLEPVQVSYQLLQIADGLNLGNGQASASATGGTGNFSFSWSNGETGTSATDLNGGETICLIAEDEIGCSDDTCFFVPYHAEILPQIDIDSVSCYGDVDGQITFSVSGGIAPYTFSWTFIQGGYTGSGDLEEDGQIQQLTGLPAGDYQIQISDGWNDTTFVLSLFEPPLLEIQVLEVSDPLCQGECSGSISILPLGGTPPYEFTWDGATGGANLNELCAGHYALSLTDSKGCLATAAFELNDPVAFTAQILQVQAISCYQGSNGSLQVVTSEGEPASVIWNTGSNQSLIQNLPEGNYSVTVTNANNCPATASIFLNAPDEALTVNLNIVQPVSCYGEEDAILEALVDGPGDLLQYAWSASTDNTSLLEGLGAGSYAVTVENETGCTAEAQTEITQPDPIQAQWEIQDVNCPDGLESGSISLLQIEGGTEPYLFSINDQTFTNQTQFNGLPEGSYTVQVQDVQGCTESWLWQIDAPPLPTVDLGGNRKFTLGEEFSITAQTNLDGLVYSWQTNLPYDCSTDLCHEIQLQALYSGQLGLTVTDTSTLCSAEDFIFIEVDKTRHVYIPNAFSPNGDGLNDLLQVFGGPDVLQINHLRLYDRFGGLMFEALNFQPGDPLAAWDGYWRGRPAPTGTYVYTAQITFIDGTTETFSGDITLVR